MHLQGSCSEFGGAILGVEFLHVCVFHCRIFICRRVQGCVYRKVIVLYIHQLYGNFVGGNFVRRVTVLVGGGLLCVMQKNQQCLSPPPCRMTVQRNLWIPNASFLFHSIVKM